MIGLPVIKVEGSKINILILLYKKECSLCNLAEDMVLKNIKENDWSLKKVDIENDLNLFDEFKYKIPVLHRPDNNTYIYWPFPLSKLKKFLT